MASRPLGRSAVVFLTAGGHLRDPPSRRLTAYKRGIGNMFCYSRATAILLFFRPVLQAAPRQPEDQGGYRSWSRR